MSRNASHCETQQAINCGKCCRNGKQLTIVQTLFVRASDCTLCPCFNYSVVQLENTFMAFYLFQRVQLLDATKSLLLLLRTDLSFDKLAEIPKMHR